MTEKEKMKARKLSLEKAAIKLKKEFVGLDGIIDEITDILLPWWIYPHLQIRPTIINLWGMTGSGKTALVRRLSEIIDHDRLYMRFDMGEFGSNSSFLKYTLTNQLLTYSGTNPIILLDEFQFAKTIDENGKEINNNALRIIWDLLDSGKLIYEPQISTYYIDRIKKYIDLLKNLQKRGLNIHKGIVTHRVKDAHECFAVINKLGYEDGSLDRTDGKMPFKQEEIFISDIFCTVICDINSVKFGTWKTVAELIKDFNDVSELIGFLELTLEEEVAFKVMDLSKAIIFVVGNLDEAFTISRSINPDIDADEYRRFTEKINVSDIKSALQRRFRNEQIARLGNNHLIYKSFSHKDFQSFIRMLLRSVSTMVNKSFGVKLSFTPATERILYQESVFPTQGVRPVMSTIRNLVEGNFMKVLFKIREEDKGLEEVTWDFNGETFVIGLSSKDKKSTDTLKLPFVQKVNVLRKSTKNNLQALVGVHEAGHVLAAMMIIGIVPEYVVSRTVDSESQGFAYTILPDDLETRKLLVDRIKLCLGGYVAEQLIFGKENNTTGVSDDLSKATNLAHQIVREYGMNDEPFKQNIHVYGGNSYNFTFDEVREQAAKEIIENCLADTRACIEKHKPFLLMVADYLSDNSRLDKEELISMAQVYAKKQKLPPFKFISKEEYYDFRSVLKKLVE